LEASNHYDAVQKVVDEVKTKYVGNAAETYANMHYRQRIIEDLQRALTLMDGVHDYSVLWERQQQSMLGEFSCLSKFCQTLTEKLPKHETALHDQLEFHLCRIDILKKQINDNCLRGNVQEIIKFAGHLRKLLANAMARLQK